MISLIIHQKRGCLRIYLMSMQKLARYHIVLFFSDVDGFNSYSIDETTSINNAINYLSTNGIDKPFIIGVELDSRLFKTDFNAKLFLLAQCL